MTCDGTEQHSVAGAEAWHMAWHGMAWHGAALEGVENVPGAIFRRVARDAARPNRGASRGARRAAILSRRDAAFRAATRRDARHRPVKSWEPRQNRGKEWYPLFELREDDFGKEWYPLFELREAFSFSTEREAEPFRAATRRDAAFRAATRHFANRGASRGARRAAILSREKSRHDFFPPPPGRAADAATRCEAAAPSIYLNVFYDVIMTSYHQP